MGPGPFPLDWSCGRGSFRTIPWVTHGHTPVEVGSLSHSLQGFSTIPGGAGFQPSTV